MDELTAWPATAVVAALRAGEISVAETLDALEARIDAVDGQVNALPISPWLSAASFCSRCPRRKPTHRASGS